MNGGNVGSRARVPYYTPRLPGAGGGGGGVFQPRGGTPWKPNRFAEGIGGLGQLYGSYLQGSEVGRKRGMEEQTFPLELELLKARAEQYRRPRGTVYPESYQTDLAAAVDALNTGEYDVFEVFRSMSQRYPAQSAELRRILLAEEPASDLEAWLQMQPEFQKQWDETKPQKKQFQLPGATPFGITPLPGAEPGAAPTPLPGARPGMAPTPVTRYITPKQRIPTDMELQGKLPAEFPRKVTPGLEAIAQRKLKPVIGQDQEDVIGGLMHRPSGVQAPLKKTTPKQTFETYPAPKTEKEFDETIKHIPSKEMKILYFETMIRRIPDEELAKRMYDKWSDELYQ